MILSIAQSQDVLIKDFTLATERGKIVWPPPEIPAKLLSLVRAAPTQQQEECVYLGRCQRNDNLHTLEKENTRI